MATIIGATRLSSVSLTPTTSQIETVVRPTITTTTPITNPTPPPAPQTTTNEAPKLFFGSSQVTTETIPGIPQNIANVITAKPTVQFPQKLPDIPQPVPIPKPDKGLYIPPEKQNLVYDLSNVSKFVDITFDSKSETFVSNVPKILFITEYFSDEAESLGALIVFEKYQDATHYEVFKRNIFQEDSEFERILFLDAASFTNETSKYVDYLKYWLEILIDTNTTCVFFDPLIKEDRIYEYKIKATRIPNSVAELDFDSIVKSRQLDTKILVPTQNISSAEVLAVSQKTLAKSDYVWIAALLNNNISFFGKFDIFNISSTYSGLSVMYSTNPFSYFPAEKGYLLLVKDPKTIETMIGEAFSLFPELEVLKHIINVLGGLNDDFVNSFVDAVNVQNHTFDENLFLESIRKKIKTINGILYIKNGQYSKDSNVTNGIINKIKAIVGEQGVDLPQGNGPITYLTLDGLSSIFKTINRVVLVALRTQGGNNENQLAELFLSLNLVNF